MKSMEQIDKKLNQKMDKYDSYRNTKDLHEFSENNGILDYINALLWMLELQDYLALPPATKQRLEKLGH